MHDAADNLFQILYVSQLRPESGVEVVKDIVAVSRRTNPARGITGALLFDGEHFGQLLEGPEPDVTALMQRIETDPRHHQVTLLFSGPADAARRMRAWCSGYCDVHQLEALAADPSRRGPAALAAFRSMLAGADVE